MKTKWIFIAPLAILAMALFAFIGGEVVRLLWNWLLPPLFGVARITFWQALGMLALCRILFGGCGLRGSSRSHRTSESRERIRQAMRRRFGLDPSTSESQGQ